MYGTFVIFIYFLSIIFVIFPIFQKNQSIFFIFWLIIAFTLSLILRHNLDTGSISSVGNTSDIIGYIKLFRNDNDGIYFCLPIFQPNLLDPVVKERFGACINFTQEFVSWGALKYIYIIVQSEVTTLIIYDLIVFLILFFSISKIEYLSKDKNWMDQNSSLNYFKLLIIVYFPFIFGMNVILRQHLSMALAFLAIIYLLSSQRFKSFFIYVLSIFSHNGAIILLPLIMSFKNKILNFFSVSVSTFFIYFIIRSFSDQRFSVEMGFLYSNGILFLTCISFIILIILYLNQRQIVNYEIFILFKQFLIKSILVLSIVASIGLDNFTHRFSYFYILILILFIFLFVENFFNYKIVKILLILFSFILLIYFHPNLIL